MKTLNISSLDLLRHHLESGDHCYEFGNRPLHNLDGPALITSDGLQAWMVNGIHIKDSNELEMFKSDEGKVFLTLKYGKCNENSVEITDHSDTK